jgi:hypothetical protein
LEYWNIFNVSSSNLHYCNCVGYDTTCRKSKVRYYTVPNSHGFYTYAAFWNSKNVYHFVDNNIIFRQDTVLGALRDKTKPMFIENSLQVFDYGDDPNDEIVINVDLTNPTDFPMTYQTDYIRAYHLKQDCNTNVTIIPNFFTYYYALKKTIRLSGTTIVPTSLSISLRAVDEIELQDGFEVPNGTTLYLNTNECY